MIKLAKSLAHSSCQFNHCFLVTVRSGGYEPPFCQYGGWTVAVVRKTNNLRCLKTRPFFKESLIISSAVAARSFVPALRFETLEMHKVCLRISNLVLCQNLAPSTLAEITSDSLNAKTPALPPNGQKASVSNVDFFRLTLAAPAYSLCTAIHNERKSRAFMILFLVLGKSGNRLIVCGAANLQRGVECIHNLQNAVYYQIPRRFS